MNVTVDALVQLRVGGLPVGTEQALSTPAALEWADLVLNGRREVGVVGRPQTVLLPLSRERHVSGARSLSRSVVLSSTDVLPPEVSLPYLRGSRPRPVRPSCLLSRPVGVLRPWLTAVGRSLTAGSSASARAWPASLTTRTLRTVWQ